MELKKSPNKDLQNRRGLFFEIGLVATLLFVIGMFSVSQAERKIEIPESTIIAADEEIMEVTRQDERPPAPPRSTVSVYTEIINIVKDDTKIETEFTFDDFDEDAIVSSSISRTESGGGRGGDEPFLIVEDMPQFEGKAGQEGLERFRAWVLKQIRYPDQALSANIAGRVTAEFVIEKDGSLSSINIISSPHSSLSNETIRVLNQSPKWVPGRQRNMPARVKFTLPVDFRINN